MGPAVHRLFVEKRPGFDVEAGGLLHDLRDGLGAKGLRRVRVMNRYDVSGVTDEEFAKARGLVFSEPMVDQVFDETVDLADAAAVVAVEPLPGQYDQRADSAAQCVQILTCGERPLVRTARIVALYGELDDAWTRRIEDWLVNPVESRLAAPEKPTTLEQELSEPDDVPVADGFRSLDAAGLAAMRTTWGFAMSLDDLAFCLGYFRAEGRDPSETELRVLDTYWSDHCRHTTFLTRIREVGFEGEGTEGAAFAGFLRGVYDEYLATRGVLYAGRLVEKPVCLMDLATIAMKKLRREGRLADLDESEEINACSLRATVEVDGRPEEWLVMFKNETHNHPTEIEPFGGAATCLGGAIRDPLSGRSYVYQAMRVTGAGDPRTPFDETLPGKLPQRRITTGAAAGYSSYGNQIGLATGLVDEVYHPGYVAKRMEIGAVIAAAPAANVVRLEPRPGDRIVLLGGRTGRDGCGGATGSSKEHDETSIETCASEVQKGNPPTERKIQRLFRDPDVSRRIRRCNDFGAGGVSVAIGELADGLRIDLDRVPKKYDGLSGTELAISESQERMAVVLAPEDVAPFLAAAHRENLEATEVAEVLESPRMSMIWRGKTIVDLSRDFLNSNGAPSTTTVRVAAPKGAVGYFERMHPDAMVAGVEAGAESGFPERLRGVLGGLAGCSRRGLAERFDATIGAGTVLMPFGGARQLTPEEGMAARIPVQDGETDDCTLMTYGFDPYLAERSPFHGAVYAVAESLARIAAMGGDASTARLTLQEYFEKTGADPLRWGKPFAALLGAYYAQTRLGTPAIGGKDSMSGSFKDLDVPPTLVSFAVALSKASRTTGAAFTAPGRAVWLIPVPRDGLGLPDLTAFGASLAAVRRLHEVEAVTAAATVRATGVAAAVARMSFGNAVGFRFLLPAEGGRISGDALFMPGNGGLVLELAGSARSASDDVAGLLEAAHAVRLGTTTADPVLEADGRRLALDEALAAWEAPLESVFPSHAAHTVPVTDLPLEEVPTAPAATATFRHAPAVRSGMTRPRVFIPVFPGTNCEYDTARAFARAGAEPDVMVLRNLRRAYIEESMREMAERIADSQMVMLPGGFSGGDEPDGSGKFIATAFRNPYVAEATLDLLNRRDGLVLGICNGFQALVKLGLLPYGDIRDLSSADPTLTFNTIGRHISRYVRTRVQSVRSPWLARCEPGDVHWIPVSHGEGRFFASPAQIDDLFAKGQVATRYVDEHGAPSGDPSFNLNGSVEAVEGITSPDGRVFGKMGHSERRGPNLARNLGRTPEDFDQHLFEAGTAYFRT
jgi:phosphoribosylformylglycinamidine synthase